MLHSINVNSLYDCMFNIHRNMPYVYVGRVRWWKIAYNLGCDFFLPIPCI